MKKIKNLQNVIEVVEAYEGKKLKTEAERHEISAAEILRGVSDITEPLDFNEVTDFLYPLIDSPQQNEFKRSAPFYLSGSLSYDIELDIYKNIEKPHEAIIYITAHAGPAQCEPVTVFTDDVRRLIDITHGMNQVSEAGSHYLVKSVKTSSVLVKKIGAPALDIEARSIGDALEIIKMRESLR